jgi:hypothetical protein
LTRCLAIICILLQAQVAYNGYTQCQLLESPVSRELSRNVFPFGAEPRLIFMPRESQPSNQDAAPADGGPRFAPGFCGSLSCPIESPEPQSPRQSQKDPARQKSNTAPAGFPRRYIILCSHVTGVPSERLLTDAVDYLTYTPNDLINMYTGAVMHIFSDATPPRNIHPAIGTTVLRI